MSIYDLMRDGVGQVYQPDPHQREAAALFVALFREVGDGPYFELDRYPTGRRILHFCAPELQLALVEVAFLEFFAHTMGHHPRSHLGSHLH